MNLSASPARAIVAASVAAIGVVALVALRPHSAQRRVVVPPPSPPPVHRDPPPPAAPVAPRCNVTITTAPLPLRGHAPSGNLRHMAWLGDRLVEFERNGNGTVDAQYLDAAKMTWRAVRLPGARTEYLDEDELTATPTSVVYVPGNPLDERPSLGGIFDATTATWRKPTTRVPLQGWTSSYRTVTSDHWILYTYDSRPPAPASARILFNPDTLEVIELPAPPFADPREQAVVAVDDDNVVVWGGYQRDATGYAARVFSDGAVFRIKDRRWDSIPKGPSARSQAVFDLHAGKLMLFGGVDPVRSHDQNSLPTEMMDDVVTGAYVLDLATLSWRPLPFDWTHWARLDGPARQTSSQTDIDACWACGPVVALRSGTFFARGLFYDAGTQMIQRIPPVVSPASWTHASPDMRALDDHHVLATVPGTADALVLDTSARTWCAATLPAALANTEDDLIGGGSTTAHDGSLYIWHGGVHFQSDYMPMCMIDDPRCDRSPRIIDEPARGAIVTFTWD